MQLRLVLTHGRGPVLQDVRVANGGRVTRGGRPEQRHAERRVAGPLVELDVAQRPHHHLAPDFSLFHRLRGGDSG